MPAPWRTPPRGRHIAYMARPLFIGLALAMVVLVPMLVLRSRIDHGISMDDAIDPDGPLTQGGTVTIDSIRSLRNSTLERIADSDTYLRHMLSEGDSSLRRWPERTDRPLRVYLPSDGATGYSPAFGRAVEDAFNRWPRVGGIPVYFSSYAIQPVPTSEWRGSSAFRGREPGRRMWCGTTRGG
jgi:hypothetical protein